ncbi:hypothetical protein E8E13_005557 [Curvularia kusanoi]|uniref:Uncharacterized protein n=1 Tax=Curvularia kusanoi TaxID=90978 RepID=A0A9P4TFN0_CURKU|nr:hypothetical protein E8E13_005557 [Curvularia kusanoi]
MPDQPTTEAHPTIIHGTPHVTGSAAGPLLASSLELSFWGGVDQTSGQVIDRSHPLCGQYLKDKILAIPGGRGSCSGSATILELIMNGNGPKALVFERTNEILAVGVFVAEELFGKSVPVVIVGPENFKRLLGWNGCQVHVRYDRISTSPLDEDSNSSNAGTAIPGPELDDIDKALLSGPNKAHTLAMRIIIRTATITSAPSLLSVTSAHVDGAHFGPASLLFGARLLSLGGRFSVPTTVNALTIDQQRWRSLGVDVSFGTESEDLANTFLAMGARPSFTCAPYQLASAPRVGEQVAFGESNAVCYANSVLGAKTAKYPNMLEALIALTGRAPRSGMHVDKNRAPGMCIVAPQLGELAEGVQLDDTFWSLLGHAVGARAGACIPLVTGLEDVRPAPSRDALKAFAASFATGAGAPMFHMSGVTPEAGLYSALLNSLPSTVISWTNLADIWLTFNPPVPATKIDLISFGSPHFSLNEIKRLVSLIDDQNQPKLQDTSVIVTTSRAQHALATQAGYVARLEAFGVQTSTGNK